MSARAPRAFVGCSGWEYAHWKGDFYPSAGPRTRWFQHYARVFDTVEINNSFYRLPPRQTMARWRLQAPAGFTYAVKASRFLTHMKKLKDANAPLSLLFDRALALGPHLGAVLYQLPPRWKADFGRLESFLRLVPRDVRQAIEFRDAAWHTEQTFELLRRYGVALCVHDMTGCMPARRSVGPFVYVRFHGATAKYSGSYSDAQLQDWAEWIAAELAAGRDAFVYFNNDVGGHAPRNALRLREMVQEKREWGQTPLQISPSLSRQNL
jgi:uncharacterized protein YecE (DUF72 family)